MGVLRPRILRLAVVLLALCSCRRAPTIPAKSVPNSMEVVLLGTGTPTPDPHAWGPATAVRVGEKLFLFDAGVGVERQLAAAKLSVKGPTALFVTHLHSDHTLGLPDLIFTSWIKGRTKPFEIDGPHGIADMTNHFIDAFREDIQIRTEGLEHESPGGYKVNVHEIMPGIVYDHDGIRVTAFPVAHGSWPEAFGYRLDAPGGSVVISGDTRPCKSLTDAARRADILVAEVYSETHLMPEKRPGGDDWPKYMRSFHTSDRELGAMAADARPHLLVMTHVIRMGASDAELLAGVRSGGFRGNVAVGHDLARFEVPPR